MLPSTTDRRFPTRIKETYEKPEMEICVFDSADVIVTSLDEVDIDNH